MDVIIHKDLDALDKVLLEWNEMKTNFLGFTVFQNREWLRSWWRYRSMQQELTPYIVEVRSSKKTIAVIPLYSYKTIFNFRLLRPIGTDMSDYLVPIISDKYPMEIVLNSVAKKMIEDKRYWDCMFWTDLPEKSNYDEIFFNQLSGNLRLIGRKRTDKCPYILLSSEFEKVKLNLNKKFLKKVLFKERKLIRQQGDYSYFKVNSKDDIELVMNKFFELHCKRWEHTTTPSSFIDPGERENTLSLAKELFHNNLLHLSYLTVNNQIMAVHYGMSDGNRLYYYLPTFDDNFGKYSVGHILIYNLIREACEEGYQYFDFLRGDEGYKQEWGATETFNVEYIFMNNSINSRIFRFFYELNNLSIWNSHIRRFAERLLLLTSKRVNK